VGESDGSSSKTARPSDYVQDDFRAADGAQINVSAKSLLKDGTSRASMSFH
jgi:hypothetical protein